MWDLVTSFVRPYDCTVSDFTLRSFGFLLSPTPPGLVPDFTLPYGYSVSDWNRVGYTPTSSPHSHSSLSCVLRFLGFCISTSKRLTTSSVESMYRNSTDYSLYDDQSSVWGSVTSSRLSSLSFITPTPFHFLSVSLTFWIFLGSVLSVFPDSTIVSCLYLSMNPTWSHTPHHNSTHHLCNRR